MAEYAAYLIALAVLAVYWLRQVRTRPLGATAFFIFFIFFFHGPALYFYVEVWVQDFGLGLLGNAIPYSEELVARVVTAMTICVLMLWIGCVLGDMLFHGVRAELAMRQRAALPRPTIRTVWILVGALSLFVLTILAIQFLLISGPAAISNYYLNPSLSDLERVLIRRESQISFYPYGILINTVVPLLSFILVAEAVYRRHFRLAALAAMFALLVLFAKLASYTKAGPALIIAQLIYCYVLARRQSTFLSQGEFVVFTLAMSVIFGIVMLIGESTDAIAFFDRLFLIPNEVLFEYFAAIPESFPYGWGRGISWIQVMTGDAVGENLPTHMHVAAVTRAEYGTVVNSFFVADAWAEFSWPGIIMFSIAAGLLVRWYDARTYKVRHSSIRIALTVFAVTGAYALATGAITTALITGGMFICPIFATWLDRRHRARSVTLRAAFGGIDR